MEVDLGGGPVVSVVFRFFCFFPVFFGFFSVFFSGVFLFFSVFFLLWGGNSGGGTFGWFSVLGFRFWGRGWSWILGKGGDSFAFF